MIRAVAIDDEVKMHRQLSRMLQLTKAEVELVGTATSVAEGVKLIKAVNPELLFLDVELGNSGTGFDVLERIEAGKYIIIFISAHNKYFQQALQFESMEFLTKPLQSQTLTEGLRRARLRFSQGGKTERLHDLKEAMRNAREKTLPSRLTLSVAEGIFYVPIEDILYLSKSGNIVTVHTVSGQKIHKAASLVEFEDLFEPYGFFMLVHQSSLVNLKKVQALVDTHFLLMEDGTRIKIKDRGVKRVREVLATL